MWYQYNANENMCAYVDNNMLCTLFVHLMTHYTTILLSYHSAESCELDVLGSRVKR